VSLFQHFAEADFRARPALLTETAATAGSPRESSYEELLTLARQVQARLQKALKRTDLRDVRVALLYPGGLSYTAAMLGVWLAGGIAVPLHQAHPKPELDYLLADAGVSALLVGQKLAELAGTLQSPPKEEGLPEMQTIRWDAEDPATAATDSSAAPAPQSVSYGDANTFASRRALFIYTSGTTGRPKGVVWTHRMLSYQMRTLGAAWSWSAQDRILCVLPMHHIHGLVNVLLCAQHAGARVTFPPGGKASAEQIAARIMDRSEQGRLNVFMAVPTIYSQLLAWVRASDADTQARFRAAAQSFRLMVSGSAALPAPVLSEWESRTGVLLLERYGMSETGMTLSQDLDVALRRRQANSVGRPLPGVEVRIVPQQEDAGAAKSAKEGAAALGEDVLEVGDLRVRGEGIFHEYWRKPEKTAEEFDEQGFFKTGDVVAVSRMKPADDAAASAAPFLYRLLGRASVDVLKSGGYKLSALDVERTLLEHPDIDAAAVLGLPDEQFGQKVAAVIQLRPGCDTCATSADALQQWARARMASYAIPRAWRVVKQMPRNAMGKTNKKELAKLFEQPKI